VIRGAPIGKRFEHCTFDNFEITDDNRDAYLACKRVAEEGESGVLILGKHGLGKTHLLVAMMKEYNRIHSYIPANTSPEGTMITVPSAAELIATASQELEPSEEIPSLARSEIEEQAHIEFWPLLDLTSELRSDIAHGSLLTSTRCRECDLLVLDDFGAERVTDFVLEELERIVDWRYRSMKPTAVATNFDFKTIIAKYGQRAISRWVGSCIVVGVTGDDRRASTGPV
jgi:DNA replication protein DnaC